MAGRGRPPKIQSEEVNSTPPEVRFQSVNYGDEIVTFFFQPLDSDINPVLSLIETQEEFKKRDNQIPKL